MEINAVIFGATGMIGQGVLIECLAHPGVKSILVVGRRTCGVEHEKLREIIHDDFLDYSAVEDRLGGYNACFFCLGVSVSRMSEQKYHSITHDITVKAAEALARQNKDMTFCYVSGAGSKPESRIMWARVKGKAEESLKSFPFKGLFIMRPAYIQPMKGIKPSYFFYKVFGPFFPVWNLLFPRWVTTTEEVGLAMIHAALQGEGVHTLENRDIRTLAKKGLRTSG